jgi:hypothetical protein
MVNPTQIIAHIDNLENAITINSGDNLDFSIHTLHMNQGNASNLNLSVTYISHLDNSKATTYFKIGEYYKGNGVALVLNNNPIYIRTIKNSDIKLVFKSLIADDIFDLNISYMFV